MRVLEQALRALGYEDCAQRLEAASGVQQQPAEGAAFRSAVLAGDFDAALRLLPAVAADAAAIDTGRYLLLRRKYEEGVVRGETAAALQVRAGGSGEPGGPPGAPGWLALVAELLPPALPPLLPSRASHPHRPPRPPRCCGATCSRCSRWTRQCCTSWPHCCCARRARPRRRLGTPTPLQRLPTATAARRRCQRRRAGRRAEAVGGHHWRLSCGWGGRRCWALLLGRCCPACCCPSAAWRSCWSRWVGRWAAVLGPAEQHACPAERWAGRWHSGLLGCARLRRSVPSPCCASPPRRRCWPSWSAARTTTPRGATCRCCATMPRARSSCPAWRARCWRTTAGR